MSLYPDNVPRANRVQSLAGDIARDQNRLKEDVEDATAQDKMMLETLNDIAVKAGYKTLDEYIAKAEKQLTPEEKAHMEKMKTDMEKLDEDMAISHKVFRGLIAAGLLTHGIRIFLAAFKETQSLIFGMMAVVRAVYHSILGAVETAAKFLTWGRATLNLTSRAAGVGEKALRGMKFLKLGGNLMIGIGVVVDSALLIAEAIQGAKQRDDLQDAITTLCARRFIVRNIQQQARAILNFKSDARSIIKTKKKHQEWIDKKRMTEEESKEELEPDMNEAADGIKKKMDEITPEKVMESLAAQDKDAGAWTTEDPNLAKIQKWIEDHPTKEDKLVPA